MESKLHHVNYSTKDVGAVADFTGLIQSEAGAELWRCLRHPRAMIAKWNS